MIVDMRQRIALRDLFLKTFTDAAKQRDSRQFTVYDPAGHREPGWAAYERQAMLEAVNAELKTRGLPEVTEERIWRVELTAVGHCDYAEKYALRCAFLIEEAQAQRPRQDASG